MTLDSTFHTKIVGATFKNDDGSDRQRIIRNLARNGELEEGTELFFVPQPTNPYDSNCVLVNAPNGQTLGTLSRDMAAQIAPRIRQGYKYKAFVAAQTGGDIGYAYGINIRVECYKENIQRTAAPSASYDSSFSNMYPHVIRLKEMFEDFFPEYRSNVIRDEESWRYINSGNMFWADQALQLKRQGKYVESCGLYFTNILARGEVTLGWAQGIYKTLACAGDIADALAFGREWFNYVDNSLPEPDSLLQHFQTLITLVQKPELDSTVFPQYLQSISGNPNYKIEMKRTDLYTDEILRKIRENA